MDDNTKKFLLGIIIVIIGIIIIAIGVYTIEVYSTVTSVIGLILIAGGGFLAYKNGQSL